MKKIDTNSIVGNKYNRWTVLSCCRIKKANKERIYCTCICECGNTKDVSFDNLAPLKTISCGCHHKEVMQLKRKHGYANKNISEYNSWCGMRDRCNNPKNNKYKNYGGRGIRVCERWDDFNLFLQDMGKKPLGRYTIERLDVNGNYEPSNCVWATDYIQFRNRTDNRWIEINGERKILSDWCRKYKISTSTVQVRLKCGWDIEKSIKTPVRAHKKYEYSK